MGQKSNPIVLRLERTNQHWASFWYNDYAYATQFLEDFRIDTYIQNCSQQLKRIPPVSLLRRDRGQIQAALLSPRPQGRGPFPRGGRRRNPQRLPAKGSISLTKPRATGFVSHGRGLPRGGSFLEKRVHLIRGLLLLGRLGRLPIGNVSPAYGHKMIQSFGGMCLGEMGQSGFYRSIVPMVEGLCQGPTPPLGPYAEMGKRWGETPLKSHIESSIGTHLSYRCKIHLLKCPSISQNPLFLTSHVVSLLQERIPFRRLKQGLINEIRKDATIKGVRIVCSGRVATRSKKAQKARTDSIQWGETSLNVFSEFVHFIGRNAQTAFGKIGVKVWICYRQPRHAYYP